MAKKRLNSQRQYCRDAQKNAELAEEERKK